MNGRVPSAPGSRADAPSRCASRPPASIPSRASAFVRQVSDQCRVVAHLATVLARVHADYVTLATVPVFDDIADQVGARSAHLMEMLGDALNAMDAGSPDDEWTYPIFEAAQRQFPACVSDGSGEAGETGTGSTEGNSAVGAAETPTSPTSRSDRPLSAAPGGEEILDVCPDLGAQTREPSIRKIVHAYYAPHFLGDEADRLTDAYCAALARTSALRSGEALERVRHVKSGKVYEVLGKAEGFQADEYGEHHLHKIIVYRSVVSRNLLWMLPSHFRGGRFEPVTPPTAPAAEEAQR